LQATDWTLAAPVQEVLDAAISITKKNALRRNGVPWEVVEPKVRALAAGAEKSTDVYPAIRYLLTQLGDHHSFLVLPAQTSQFQTGGAQNPIPEVRALPEGVGYISVPGYSGAERGAMRTYATRMYEALGGTIASVSCGWVVDLRPDTGGNMWPMLAGLKPFFWQCESRHVREFDRFQSAMGRRPRCRRRATINPGSSGILQGSGVNRAANGQLRGSRHDCFSWTATHPFVWAANSGTVDLKRHVSSS